MAQVEPLPLVPATVKTGQAKRTPAPAFTVNTLGPIRVTQTFLDNLRAEDATDHFLGRRVLEENLVARANSARPTILTTPLVFGELDDPKGPWRGLLQASRLTYANVQGPDLREKLLRTTKDLLQTPVTNPMPRGTK